MANSNKLTGQYSTYRWYWEDVYAVGLVSESHFLRANVLLWFALLNATILVGVEYGNGINAQFTASRAKLMCK